MPLVFCMAHRLPPAGPARHHATGMQAMANVNATIKETVSGIAIAKNFRQESSVYDEFDDANRQSYRVNVRRGLVLSLVFPTLNALGGLATAAPGLCRRVERHPGAGDRRRLVPVHPEPGPLSLPGHEPVFLLDPGADRPLRRRARLRPDRRRTGRGARPAADPVAGLRGEIDFEQRLLPLLRKRTGAGRFQPAHPPRRNRGPGRAYRRGQILHRQADRPLLRIPGRPPADRRAGYPHLRPQRTTAASWASSRRCPSCSPARSPRISAMPARMPPTPRSKHLARQIGDGEWLETLPAGAGDRGRRARRAALDGPAPAGLADARAGAAPGHLHPG